MFILSKLSDLVQITPEDFSKRSIEAIKDNLNAKYSNKVIKKVGLCVCVWDVTNASDGQIGHGTGIANVNVEFHLLVFRPFKGEIILGRIASATQSGIKIRLDFFEDITVPPHLLFEGSKFNAQEQVWIWNNAGVDYYYDKHEWVRFRVESEEWHEEPPKSPAEQKEATAGELKSPYSIIASMRESSLGLTDWWDEDEDFLASEVQ